MAQRAQIFLNLAHTYSALLEKTHLLLEEADHNGAKGSDTDLIHLFMHETELDPQHEMEQLLGLFERLNINSDELKTYHLAYNAAREKAESLIEDCPFDEPHLTNKSLEGHGKDHEEISLRFDQGDVEIHIEPPFNDDEENLDLSLADLRYDLEQWPLEEM